ncbi:MULTISPECIES: serine/threonine protein kinase [unclassified Mycobacterium]|uniref:serine/threonine protein kinase n=1 Tax=unclassified Mycobacterium TaxID=2642494 RepID=UPI0027407064|nr:MULTISPECIES: serine/threonine protein kinase [unclassified Mycobacterium]MDP7704174.1 serine/threonine protein kinase [Mycobacterium sp. TY815]MDP7722657.1 serine/threonine protein kinase [Mycobacterium sp. TY814]
MTYLKNALRGVTTAALVGGFACTGVATASADPTDAFAGSLSKGYSSSNCASQAVSEVQSAFPTVQAVLACGQNSDSSGPASAKYFQFPNSADLASAFTKLIGSDTLTNCGDAKSPTVWHQGSSTDSAGQVACGTDDGKAEVIWTVDAKNVLAFVRASGGDTSSLYQWWRTNG